MGHDSSHAALIYQHATAEADRAIAQALHEAVRADRKSKKSRGGSGKKSSAKKDKKRPAERDGGRDDRVSWHPA
ncbi:hypothetical protein [Micromonospora pattaloongensis]